MEIEHSQNEVARRYRRKHRVQDVGFRVFDRMLAAFIAPAAPPADWNPESVRRVLIANAGHLGDLVLCTTVIQSVRAGFPRATVGLLAGSWSRNVYERNPLVERLHVLDHWYTNRADLRGWQKLSRYRSARRRVIEELRRHRYDVAIDVRMWFPNFIPVLWNAGIPVRVGFDRVGFGPMLTRAAHVTYGGRHELEDQLSLIKLICEAAPQSDVAHPGLPPSPTQAIREVDELMGRANQPFIVLHVGSSTPTKDWPPAKWGELARRLGGTGRRLVFTGLGDRERRSIDLATQGLTGYVNACDRLSWAGLVELVRRAELVYSTETSVGHVAAAVHTPIVTIYGGTSEPARWKPYGAHCVVATHEPSCFPCLRRRGCRAMTCLTELSADTVYVAGTKFLSLPPG